MTTFANQWIRYKQVDFEPDPNHINLDFDVTSDDEVYLAGEVVCDVEQYATLCAQAARGFDFKEIPNDVEVARWDTHYAWVRSEQVWPYRWADPREVESPGSLSYLWR